MDDLLGLNSRQSFEKLALSDEEFIVWLQSLGLLFKTRICSGKLDENGEHKKESCGGNGNMSYHFVGHGHQYPQWRCSKKSCRATKGFLTNTFFENSHTSLKDVSMSKTFQLSYYWSRQMLSNEEIQFEMRRPDGSVPSSGTIVDWNNVFRGVCLEKLVHDPVIIGGPGIIVEIDETVLTKPKYNRGRELKTEDQWLFGGLERGSGRVFIHPVPNRSLPELMRLIQYFIRPGTIIYSDKWPSYVHGIPKLPEGYEHYSVNHSEHFVDPETGCCTNGIESTWQKFKARHKKQYGTARTLLSSYIEQFCWRQDFKGTDILFHFWSQVSLLYPCT